MLPAFEQKLLMLLVDKVKCLLGRDAVQRRVMMVLGSLGLQWVSSRGGWSLTE